MANTDSPRGLKPVGYLSGAPYNGAANSYFIDASDAQAVYIGSLVKLDGTNNADGVPGVTAVSLAAGNVMVGVVVGIDPVTGVSSPNLNQTYRPASTAMHVFVADDPNLLFEVQADGDVADNAVGYNAPLIALTSGSTTTGLSAIELDASSIGTSATLDVQIVRGVNRADNDMTAANQKFLVRLNNHQFVDGTTGV